MNAIAKAITSGVGVGINRPTILVFSKSGMRMVTLFFLIIMSALCLLYVKDLNRCLFINYQNLQQTDNDLKVNRGELLLEKSTWQNQTRIQEMAENNLNMEIPAASNVVMLSLR
jgi:cell division protein FtsL